MKTLLRIPLLIGLLAAAIPSLFAAHIIGGEITYECLGWTNGDPSSGTRRYQFYMDVYRDCQGGGAQFDSAPGGAFAATVTIFQEGLSEPYQTIELGAPSISQVEPSSDPCVQVPPGVCVQQGRYTFPLLDLPVIDGSYVVAYQRCCRNNTITNIIEPGEAGATYAMELTAAAQEVCNNSPAFQLFPPSVICANRQLNFDHSATDAEGDQLVYEFCTPFLGGANISNNPFDIDGLAPNPEPPPPYDGVNFLAPDYSPASPLGPDANLEIDLNTGLITGFPQINGQFVVGVCVSEFRNGELLSVVRRDFQFNVTVCQEQVSAEVEQGERIGDEVFIEQCGVSSIVLENTSQETPFLQEYFWVWNGPGLDTVLESFDVDFPVSQAGRYTGHLLLNPSFSCSDTLTIIYDVFADPVAEFSFEYDTCRAGPIRFQDESVASSGSIDRWTWSFGDGRGSTASSPLHEYLNAGSSFVRLRVEDENGCLDSTQQQVRYFPVPPVIIVSPDVTRACLGQPVTFTNLSEVVDETYTTEWSFGNQDTSLAFSPTYTYPDTGTYDIGLRLTSPIGCQTDTLFRNLVTIEPSPVAGFTFDPASPDILEPDVQFINLSENANRFFWDFGDSRTSTLMEPLHTYQDTGLQQIRLVATHPLGCQDTARQVIDIFPKVTYFLPNAFSPNGDSRNDVFRGKGYLEGIRQFRLQIWNRWGAVIYSTDDPTEGWNGRVDNTGREAPAGNYLCRVVYISPRGEREEVSSTVTLIR